MNDALKQPVIIGNTYGYSASAGSRITVVVGKAVKLTPKGNMSIQVISRRNYLYGEELPPDNYPSSAVVSVHPCHLFPVSI